MHVLCVPSAFAAFPPEIILYIFHLAAASSTQACLSLCLVASWTRALALPHLLRTVTLDTPQRLLLFAHLISPSPSPSSSPFPSSSPSSTYTAPVRPPYPKFRHAHLVRAIHIHQSASPRRPALLASLLTACPHLTHLALPAHLLATLIGHTSRATHNWRPRDVRLTVIPGSLDFFWMGRAVGVVEDAGMGEGKDGEDGGKGGLSPLCKAVTHLCLGSTSATPRLLRAFPRLTHLALPLPPSSSSSSHAPFKVDPRTPLALAAGAPNVQYVAILLSPAQARALGREGVERWVRASRRVDRRVYTLVFPPQAIGEDWERVGGSEAMTMFIVDPVRCLCCLCCSSDAKPRAETHRPALGIIRSFVIS
ncbi:hypothetical protein PLICRDRAFT_180475 [Plicaturopsis crispa FD-325 SS-3]|uniref:Uncharacterized protein n=1 Tax=Plicaturopsis crispa FD-325 SS-3 TaxID=944288 RepID=A0A0C9SKA5_PLICR|nr:hypothetical protein PLICRDRAFT_180475 [Plicaturopsis crispa FD-325 SS-3]